MPRKESTIDVHQAVTDAIIAAIESGPGQFVLPWQQSGRPLALPTNAATGAAYNGLNILILLCTSAKRGYTTGKFASYRQLLAEGKQVRSGEKGTLIVFYKDYVPRDFQPSPDTPDDDGHRRVIKHSHVFALEQTVGYEPPPPPPLSDPVDLHPEIQRIITNGGFDVRMGGDKAFFNIRENFTQLPDPSLFSAADTHDRAYHVNSTCCHELGHATGHSTRLNRTFGTKYGTEAYCFEEVCAELVSSYMAAHLGLASHPRIDHAQYISHFITLMKKDNRAIFAAAAKASEATNYLLGFLRQEQAHAA